MKSHVFTTDRDREAARLGEKGFATSYIMDQTGLSAGQVQYRLTKAKIRRADFRNGLTIAARKKAKQQPSGRTLDRCVVIESVVTRMPSSEAIQLNSTKLTARMAGDAFAFYPGDKP